MAELTFKVLGTEIVCNTTNANTVSGNTLVKITNIDTAPHLINVAYANATIYGNTTVLANTIFYLQKAQTDLVSSNAATAVVFASPVKRGTT